jgi:hypothetical protein
MKKILNSRICLLVFTMATAFLTLQGCKKESVNAPVITGVRNYAPAPGDSVLQSLIPGQWVVVLGHNLRNVVEVSFDGIPATVNATLHSDTSAVVQVPAIIPFPSVPAEKLNTIYYVTPEGATTFAFEIAAPAPTISSVSNENANTGDSVYIYGLNFFFIKEVTFANTAITAYKASDDGTSIGFALPALTQSGPVIIRTKYGADTTAYNVNNYSTESLCNFDNINNFWWGTSLSNSSTDFPGNQGRYAVLNTGVLAAGDGTWWGWQRSIHCGPSQWIPSGNLGDPVEDWALKFEISVPKPWNGVSLWILSDADWKYVARIEPWKNATGNVSFKTNGWRTITIPLTSFRTQPSGGLRGTGVSANSLTQLLGSSGSRNLDINTSNDGSSPSATGLYCAIDNIRVVKVK